MPLRIVTVSYPVPHPEPRHAGGRYLLEWCRAARDVGDVTVIAPRTAVNEGQIGDVAARTLLVPERAQPLLKRVANRLVLLVDRRWRRLDVGLPYLPWVVGMILSTEARRALQQADVIDLQWSDAIRMLPLVRHLNPRARTIGTFHDVQSQLFGREVGVSRRSGAFWRLQSKMARRHERRAVSHLDVVVAFSEKDVELLGNPTNAQVVRPPLASQPPKTHVAPAVPTVVFVSYLAREENVKASLWLLQDIWPRVVAEVPTARLRLVGAGAPDELTRQVAQSASVELTGFVDDLDQVYASATAAIIPLRQGAGVKFKTIEAVLHGVPTVTTSVGAEGVAGEEMFERCTDDPEELAAALVEVLRDPGPATARTRQAQVLAHQIYGVDTFRTIVRNLLSPGLTDSD